jgi:hypothetical protein
MPANLDDYRWLIGDEAGKWLVELASATGSLLQQTSRLRKHFSPERAHLLLEQVELRRRAVKKFSAADRMFFTQVGLEQATDEVVATYKNVRFPLDQLRADLCCGIGGDLLALAESRAAVGIERDPSIALLAEANCRCAAALYPATAQVRVADATTIDLTEFAAWHIDPDRRPEGRRTTKLELHEPDLATLEEMLSRQSHAAIKLAPAAECPPRWQAEAEHEWISRDGECRQLVVWFGNLARHPGQRSATVLPVRLDRGEFCSSIRTVTGNGDEDMPFAPTWGRYLFEPDAAVLAAGLVSSLAQQLELGTLAPGMVYLTGDQPLTDAAVAGFEIEAVLPYRVENIKSLLQARGIGQLEIKKRGVDCDIERLRQQLRVTGHNRGTLIVTRVGDHAQAILAKRISTR